MIAQKPDQVHYIQVLRIHRQSLRSVRHLNWASGTADVESENGEMTVLLILPFMSFEGVEVPFTSLETRFFVEEPIQAVVGTNAEWAGLFERFTVPPEIGMLEYPPPFPAFVDFETEMLIILGLGRSPDVGVENNPCIRIDSLILRNDSLFVQFSASGPEQGVFSTLGGFVYPSCMVVIERTDAVPVFVPTSGYGM